MDTFDQKVYRACTLIPKGRVSTYKLIAEAIGHPKAYRAVGTTLAGNPYPDVPCHRVINSSREVGGYFGQRVNEAKAQRLTQEGITFDAKGRVRVEHVVAVKLN